MAWKRRTESTFALCELMVISEGKANGLGGGTYYGYEQDLLTQVKGSFEFHGAAEWDTFRETLDDFDFTCGERLKITKIPKGPGELKPTRERVSSEVASLK